MSGLGGPFSFNFENLFSFYYFISFLFSFNFQNLFSFNYFISFYFIRLILFNIYSFLTLNSYYYKLITFPCVIKNIGGPYQYLLIIWILSKYFSFKPLDKRFVSVITKPMGFYGSTRVHKAKFKVCYKKHPYAGGYGELLNLTRHKEHILQGEKVTQLKTESAILEKLQNQQKAW